MLRKTEQAEADELVTKLVLAEASERMRRVGLPMESAGRPWREMTWTQRFYSLVGRFYSVVGVVLGFGDDLISVLASTIGLRNVEWLWPDRIPLGKLTLFVGNPDNGKSLVAAYVVATITTQRRWTDGANSLSGEVLIFSDEDDRRDTTVPRLKASGADLHKVYFETMRVGKPNETPVERQMHLDKDIEALRKVLQEKPDVRLVVFDPMSNHLGNIEMNKEQEVRRVLTPLQQLAEEKRVAILGIMHLNKKQELDVIHRIGGAMAFVGVARAVWLFRATDEKRGEFHMLRVKQNIGKRIAGLVYRIETLPVDIGGEPVPQPFIEWIGPTNESADGGLARRPLGRRRDQRDEAVKWLKQFLSEGPKPANEVEAEGRAARFSSTTLERAKDEAGVGSVKGNDAWYWELTPEAQGRQNP